MGSLLRVAVCAILLAAPISAAAETADPARTLKVGTKTVPPFAMRSADGSWTGISIALWEEFASHEGIRFEWVEMGLPDLLQSLEAGSLDAVAAALTITSDREERFDFSHPFITSGLAIAMRPQSGIAFRAIVDRLLEANFVRGFALGLLALTLASIAVWAFETRKNPDQFGGGFWRGIGSALWWSVVTMTTVGYGDMAPRTVAGRLLAVVWMIAGVILISALTAAITSALTVSQLSSSVNGIADLRDRAVATVAGSAGHDYLQRRGIPTIALPSLDDCVSALDADEVWGVVHDEPLLRHFALSQPDQPLYIQAEKLHSRGYGIGLPRDSPLREPLNRFLLRHVTTPRWQAVVVRHLGASGS